MAKYIAGPWTTEDWTIWGPKDEHIADLADEYGPLYRVPGEVRKNGPKSTAIMKANANVIAAAPEMLEALQELLAAHEDPAGVTREDWVRARKAVAKAVPPELATKPAAA